jgi:geranylgeranyl diphosphate synthase type I
MNLPSVFSRYRAEIDTELRSALAHYRSPMYEMLRYHLGWVDDKGNVLPASTGKALRPTLCLLASEAVAGAHEKALPAAAAIELLHNFSLIHDDIQDDDRERRHRPTVWTIWGKPQAINAGTAMWVVASLTMMRLASRGVPIEKQIHALSILDESCLRLIEGQYLDISFESHMDVGVADYLEMVEGKTATLIASSVEMGALLGTDDEQIIRALRNFGRNLGFAFQIRDDILGIWGDEEKTGKPVGSDIRRKKKSYPIVYAWENAQGQAKTELMKIYQSAVVDDNGRDTVLNILDSLQAEVQAQNRAEAYCDRALAEIEKTALSSWARDNLKEMAHFLTKREF